MALITQLSQLDLQGTYNYADYLTWRFDDAVELIKGKIMPMSPAPNVKHQILSRNFLLKIGVYLEEKKCQIFHAPFDVKLYDHKKSILSDQEIYTVVQPDLCVICDPKRLTEQGCHGAPDWIIEILSKGNSKKEMHIKYQLYQESGVLEYWLVYPYEQVVQQFFLNEESRQYQLIAMYSSEDMVTPVLFPELKIDLGKVFVD
ncbi:Uma2 family endonuclease [Thioflexithrix psekupsensis]|uniref:Restriction endonuclease n=1 Tax=Thioflexithrix psekupsensis TaxID=1570016 RepID=A0A251X5C0_9GAMM|nr:Uma2 family endonuclease [Thioflexithrix psekupsensis]OUD12342.1 restriction endonuclease [Thioflexithrix psekupsensis]